MQSEQTKHVAERSVQSSLKNVATAVFNCAFLVQNKLLEQIGQISICPFTSTVTGSFFSKRFIKDGFIIIIIKLNINYLKNNLLPCRHSYPPYKSATQEKLRRNPHAWLNTKLILQLAYICFYGEQLTKENAAAARSGTING